MPHILDHEPGGEEGAFEPFTFNGVNRVFAGQFEIGDDFEQCPLSWWTQSPGLSCEAAVQPVASFQTRFRPVIWSAGPPDRVGFCRAGLRGVRAFAEISDWRMIRSSTWPE